jgi:mRNA-degrading endonuclease RelE of RelBE toxin-antitoxin system
LHSAGRGDYRVIYRIGDDQHLVTVIAIEHHSERVARQLACKTFDQMAGELKA